MKKRNLKLFAAIITVGMLVSGCTNTPQMEKNNGEIRTVSTVKASPKVKALLEKGGFEVVDTHYIKSKLGKGTRVTLNIPI